MITSRGAVRFADNQGEHGVEIHAHSPEAICVDLWYPSYDFTDTTKLTVGLMAVRAADEIRVSYDFQRDGWKIEQASRFEWPADDKVCDPDWQEVAFVQAWAREIPLTDEEKSR